MNSKQDEKKLAKRENDQKIMENYLNDVMNLRIHSVFK